VLEQSATTDIQLKLYEDRRLVGSCSIRKPTKLGRRRADESSDFFKPGSTEDRVQIADLDETHISREFMRIEPRSDGKVTIENISKTGIVLSDGTRLDPGAQQVMRLPLSCQFGKKVIRVEALVIEDVNLRTLSEPTIAPGRSIRPFSLLMPSSPDDIRKTDSSRGQAISILHWMEPCMEVFQSAATSADFLPKAADAAWQLIGLDTTGVLLYQGGTWTVTTVASRDGNVSPETWRPSRSILQRVVDARRTFFKVPIQDGSLQGVQSVVAAPLLDRNSQVIGGFYGERKCGGGHSALPPIGEMEAKLFELLACGIAAGLARIDQEKQLVAERVRFEQFFTPELARVLGASGEDMLAARDAEITVLFCDIKGFSRISARCSADLVIEWVRDVLSVVSDCAAEQQGVLVDYSGDALLAMWGAPLAIPDHAIQACLAGLAIRGSIAQLNQRWQERIGEVTDISIGINTGPAQVGNIGSRRKFKYGALGTTVNLSSRVQGATKYLGASFLVTESTAKQLDDRFSTRRLCSVRTMNIPDPVVMFEVADAPDAKWAELKRRYESALSLFEQAKFHEALPILGALAHEFPHDEPTVVLLKRNVENLRTSPADFNPVWDLGNK
jgi:adenylate cyclase